LKGAASGSLLNEKWDRSTHQFRRSLAMLAILAIDNSIGMKALAGL
jgi:hypothetical protein